MAKFEITTRKNGEFQFNLKAGNGEIILSSEGYKQKASCLNGIESVKKNSLEEKRFEMKEAANGKFHFPTISLTITRQYDGNISNFFFNFL